MNKYKFVKFQVKNFRSLLDITLNIDNNNINTICGENNIGKTNFLRALNLFFNHNNGVEYNQNEDRPYHIQKGSTGGRKTELIGYFTKNNVTHILKVEFHKDKIVYILNGKMVEWKVARDIVESFKLLFIEASNVNMPSVISAILENDALLALDNKRKKQSEPLRTLKLFIEQSKKAIEDIEKDINIYLKQMLDFDNTLKDKEIKIRFAEFEKLRDVVKTMTSVTLDDGNDHLMDHKGSGAQRIVLLSLMQYITDKITTDIIWAIDEPEAFLQPKLQKKIMEIFKNIVREKKQPIIMTTHSQYFVDFNNLVNTHLFKLTKEEKIYARKKGKVFQEINTKPIYIGTAFEKLSVIKKHLGIETNDNWDIMPYNILVEGEEDKKYLQMLIEILNLSMPNIIHSGGATKIAGFLEYFNNQCSYTSFKPYFICIFDNDEEGRKQYNKISKDNLYPNIKLDAKKLKRYGESIQENNRDIWEIEDFMPIKIIVDAVNIILKYKQYNTITNSQISDRKKLAFKNMSILDYLEKCIADRNEEKERFILNTESRKKEICQNAFRAREKYTKNDLEDYHVDFMNELIDSFNKVDLIKKDN
ncbi:ATP-binding protein [Campylobacter jejuni]|nr:ATP-binding protein [Campylobacter jejuni]ELU3742137.1 ATP-binding protein [Campylobacter jejuni]EMA0272560.1 ATP-binding protein [Campylobacter jejuni]